jgi:hypothetical protein
MGKIFVRERRQVGEGEREPRFRLVAALETDLRVYAPHMRRAELEQIAAASGAEIVYLPAGDGRMDRQGRAGRDTAQDQGHGSGQGRGRRRHAMTDQDLN